MHGARVRIKDEVSVGMAKIIKAPRIIEPTRVIKLDDLKGILSSISDTALEFSDDVTLKIGSFEKTKKELKETLENEVKYQEIYEQWFPYEDITPENLEAAPRRIIRAYVLATVVSFAQKLSDLPSGERNAGKMMQTFFVKQLMRFKIDSIELKAELKANGISEIFAESFTKWIFV